MFEGRQQVFGSGVSHVFAIGHQFVQAAVSLLDVGPGGSFDQCYDLQGDFEKKQVGLDALGAVQVDRFQIKGALCPAKGVLVFVLALVMGHSLFDAQVFGVQVGQQRVIAATVHRGGKGGVVTFEPESEDIVSHGHFFDRLAGRRPSAAFVLVGHQGLVVDAVGEKGAGAVFFQDRVTGLSDLFFIFEVAAVELALERFKGRSGLLDAPVEVFPFDARHGLIEDDDHAQPVVFFKVLHDHGQLKAAVETALVRQQNFSVMVGQRGLEVVCIAFVHGRRGQKMAAVIEDRRDIGRAHQLAVGHVEKIAAIEKIDQVLPLLDIGVHIGGVAAVGLGKLRKGAVIAHRHGPDQLLEVIAVLFAVPEADLDGGRTRRAGAGATVIRSRGAIVVAHVGLNLPGLDHVAGDLQFQVAQPVTKQGIEAVGQPIVRSRPRARSR